MSTFAESALEPQEIDEAPQRLAKFLALLGFEFAQQRLFQLCPVIGQGIAQADAPFGQRQTRLEFRADGTMSNPNGDTGSWTIGPGVNGNTLLTMTGGGMTLRAHLRRHENGGIKVLPLDGSPEFVIHSCGAGR